MAYGAGMLAALGDLVDDIAVRVGPINVASDTDATIVRRRGGSAANVAASAARIAGVARFLGQVGTDVIADALLAEMRADGVDVQFVRRKGRTGTIVVLVDADGERTMLVDRGSARDLAGPQPAWLDGVEVLHVPFYSLAFGPIADTAATLIGWSHERRIAVSIDASSAAVLEGFGVDAARTRIAELEPAVVFANADEAEVLGIDAPLGEAVTFVKRGARPATVFVPGGGSHDVAGERLDGAPDSTGAGDAFAAGVLTFPGWRADPVAACAAGHASAARLLASRLDGER